MVLKDIFSQRNKVLLKELVKTDFKLRYQGSFLGMLWSVLKPLALFVVMYFVFVHFLRFGAGVPHFAVSLLLAIVLWNFFSETTSQGMKSLSGRSSILRRINIPKYIVVISASVSALINLLISLVVVIVFAIFNGVEFHWTAFLMIPLLAELYIFALFVAVFLSVLYIKFQDITHIWDVLLQALFYFTPVIYPPSMVAGMSVLAAQIIMLNPVAQIIQDARYSFITHQTETIWNFIPNPILHFIPFTIIIVVSIVAISYYVKNAKTLTEIM